MLKTVLQTEAQIEPTTQLQAVISQRIEASIAVKQRLLGQTEICAEVAEQIPDAYYVNQYGVTAPQSYGYDDPNYVFNATVRQKVQDFETHALQQLNVQVGLTNIWDFRVDGGDGGEANYGPSADGQGHSNSYWAHDERLYTTTDTPSANIITLTDYSSIINQYNSNTVRVSTAVAYTDHTALNKTFPITVMNNNVEIDFSARLDNAMISAIQIVPTG